MDSTSLTCRHERGYIHELVILKHGNYDLSAQPLKFSPHWHIYSNEALIVNDPIWTTNCPNTLR